MTHREYVKACLKYGVPKYQIGQDVWRVGELKPILTRIENYFTSDDFLPFPPRSYNWIYVDNDNRLAGETVIFPTQELAQHYLDCLNKI